MEPDTGTDAGFGFGPGAGGLEAAIIAAQLAVLKHQEQIDECLHLIRIHYPNITEAEILFREWAWVRAAVRRIEDDKREARLWQLNSLVAAMRAVQGDTQMYEDMRDTCLTEDERKELQKRRKEQLREAGKLLAPRKRGERPGLKLAKPAREVTAETE